MTKKHEMNEQKLDKVAGGMIDWPGKPILEPFKPRKPFPGLPGLPGLPKFPVIK